MPLGWEVKDAHNDYFHLWAELGFLALLFYGILWFSLLKHAAPWPAGSRSEPVPRRSTWLAILGGAVAFVLLALASDSFDFVGVRQYFLNLQFSTKPLASVLATLALPLVFGAVLWASMRGEKDRVASAWSIDAGTAFGAAAAAILVHQLVDFDFKSQAVMAALLLVGGARWGEALARENAEHTPSRAGTWLPLAGALALLPLGVWIPAASGIPRADAEVLADAARQKSRDLKERRELAAEVIAARRDAASAAPFDGEAWAELAEALQEFAPANISTQNEIRACIDRAIRLRPFAVTPRMLLGNFLMHSARDGTANANELFTEAAKAYDEAVSRYPLHPGLRLMQGDAELFAGDLEHALFRYADAFEIDLLLDDPNVFLASLFTDPRPGAAVKHGLKIDLKKLAGRTNPREQLGAVVRSIVQYSQFGEPGADEALNSLTSDLMRTTAENPRQHAHAALLRALALEKTKAPLDAREQAWREADELQNRSKGTPARAYEALRKSSRFE